MTPLDALDEFLKQVLRPEFAEVAPAPGKFLLVKGVGGLGNRILAFLEAVLYARVTGRTLVVDWRDSYYSASGENAFDGYFSSPLVAPLSCLPRAPSIAPAVWSGCLDLSFHQLAKRRHVRLTVLRYGAEVRKASINPAVDYAEDLLVLCDSGFNSPALSRYLSPSTGAGGDGGLEQLQCTLLGAALSIREDIRSRAERFREDRFRGPTIGIHIRATDNQLHPLKQIHLRGYAAAIDRLLAQQPDAQLFVATDSEQVLDRHIARYRNVVYLPKFFPRGRIKALHLTTESDKQRLGAEALVELQLLAACDHLVYSEKSTFGRVARIMSHAPPAHFVDVEQSAPPRRIPLAILARVLLLRSIYQKLRVRVDHWLGAE